jgi:hypothetical protein
MDVSLGLLQQKPGKFTTYPVKKSKLQPMNAGKPDLLAK